MQSGWHNLPAVNGVDQRPAPSSARATSSFPAECDAVRLSLDIAPAYPPEAKVARYRREVALDRKRAARSSSPRSTRSETCREPVRLHFLTPLAPDVATPGRVGSRARAATPSSRPAGARAPLRREALHGERRGEGVTDARLAPVWGDRLFRITLTARDVLDERLAPGRGSLRALTPASPGVGGGLRRRARARPERRTTMERRAFLAASTAAAVTSADAVSPGRRRRPQPGPGRPAARPTSCAATACTAGHDGHPLRRVREGRARPGARPRRARARRRLERGDGRGQPDAPPPPAAPRRRVGGDARRPARGRRRVRQGGGRIRWPCRRRPAVPAPATPRSTPACRRCPAIEKPAGAVAGPDRLFELRTYRSHSELGQPARRSRCSRQGGELAIFRRDGLHTVFFARDLVGAGLPSLTYMLVFADAAAREKAWDVFRDDPEWAEAARACRATLTPRSSPASRRRSLPPGRRTRRSRRRRA